MIAICLVTKDNEKTINECIESIRGIDSKIYFTDLGSVDSTRDRLKNYTEIQAISDTFIDNKNNLIKKVEEDWLFFINPWEILISGKEEINNLTNKNKKIFKVFILNKEVINKSIRIINKKENLKFENQVHEEIYSKNSQILNLFLKQKDYQDLKEEENIKKWIEKEKLNPVPYYYMLCNKLKNKQYIEFKKFAEKYLFMEKNRELPSVIMTNYYLSLVNLHVLKKIKPSMENALACIDEKPDMAEFWCLLGDINFCLNKYQKAIYFYENAIILGKFREDDDEFSLEIKKYKIYPETMISKCKELVNNF